MRLGMLSFLGFAVQAWVTGCAPASLGRCTLCAPFQGLHSMAHGWKMVLRVTADYHDTASLSLLTFDHACFVSRSACCPWSAIHTQHPEERCM